MTSAPGQSLAPLPPSEADNQGPTSVAPRGLPPHRRAVSPPGAGRPHGFGHLQGPVPGGLGPLRVRQLPRAAETPADRPGPEPGAQ